MSDGTVKHEDRKQALSALADGESAHGDDVAQACAHWRQSDEARSTWHAYALIGDVLRSDDLAQTAAHDAAFLARLRCRLEAEPTVMAPTPLSVAAPAAGVERQRANSRRSRVVPFALAASFVAVTGVLVLTQGAGPLGGWATRDGAVLAAGPQAISGGVSTPGGFAAASLDVPTLVTDGRLIRDARLDRYLAAHKQYGGSSAVSVPGVTLRSTAIVAPERR